MKFKLKEKYSASIQDNGGGYILKFSDYLKKSKRRQQVTCPHTIWQNGVIERKNYHLVGICQSMFTY